MMIQYTKNMNELLLKRQDALQNCPFHGKPVSLFSKESDRFYCTSCPYTDTKAIRFSWYSYQPIVPYDLNLHNGVQCVVHNGRPYAYVFRNERPRGPPPAFRPRRQCVSCECPLENSYHNFHFCSVECKYVPFIRMPCD